MIDCGNGDDRTKGEINNICKTMSGLWDPKRLSRNSRKSDTLYIKEMIKDSRIGVVVTSASLSGNPV